MGAAPGALLRRGRRLGDHLSRHLEVDHLRRHKGFGRRAALPKGHLHGHHASRAAIAPPRTGQSKQVRRRKFSDLLSSPSAHTAIRAVRPTTRRFRRLFRRTKASPSATTAIPLPCATTAFSNLSKQLIHRSCKGRAALMQRCPFAYSNFQPRHPKGSGAESTITAQSKEISVCDVVGRLFKPKGPYFR